MMNVMTELSGWYWLDGELYIISDAPGAELKMKEYPEIKALTLAELESLSKK